MHTDWHRNQMFPRKTIFSETHQVRVPNAANFNILNESSVRPYQYETKFDSSYFSPPKKNFLNDLHDQQHPSVVYNFANLKPKQNAVGLRSSKPFQVSPIEFVRPLECSLDSSTSSESIAPKKFISCNRERVQFDIPKCNFLDNTGRPISNVQEPVRIFLEKLHAHKKNVNWGSNLSKLTSIPQKCNKLTDSNVSTMSSEKELTCNRLFNSIQYSQSLLEAKPYDKRYWNLKPISNENVHQTIESPMFGLFDKKIKLNNTSNKQLNVHQEVKQNLDSCPLEVTLDEKSYPVCPGINSTPETCSPILYKMPTSLSCHVQSAAKQILDASSLNLSPQNSPFKKNTVINRTPLQSSKSAPDCQSLGSNSSQNSKLMNVMPPGVTISQQTSQIESQILFAKELKIVEAIDTFCQQNKGEDSEIETDDDNESEDETISTNSDTCIAYLPDDVEHIENQKPQVSSNQTPSNLSSKKCTPCSLSKELTGNQDGIYKTIRRKDVSNQHFFESSISCILKSANVMNEQVSKEIGNLEEENEDSKHFKTHPQHDGNSVIHPEFKSVASVDEMKLDLSKLNQNKILPNLAGGDNVINGGSVHRKIHVPKKRSNINSSTCKEHPALISSLFPKISPCLRFFDENSKFDSLPWEFRRLLFWRPSLLTPIIVRQALTRSSFRASKLTTVTEDLESVESTDWIYYFGKHMRPPVFQSIRDYQKVNHFPCSFQLGRKDRLWRNLSAMQHKFGRKHFDFCPQTFCIPTDLDKLKEQWDGEESPHQWILKPPASARGIGIRLVSKWSQIPKKRPFIVQQYLHNPYLINCSKFDLRIYVFIYSIQPLCVFIHEDGLARFASQKYSNSPRTVGNRFIHLTNYSINRLNVEYISNTSEQSCKGHKWSLRAFWAYMRTNGVNDNEVWKNIKDVIVKTCISTEIWMKTAVEMYCPSSTSVQELFGFDIFLDENLKPWILEVNVSPSMHSDSPLDVKVKGNVVKDMLNLTGIRLPEIKDVSNGTVKCLPLAKTTPLATVTCQQEQTTTQTNQTTDASTSDTNSFSHQWANSSDVLGHISRPAQHSPPAKESSSSKARPVKRPTSPSHPWLYDRRLSMPYLSDDERYKHEYYSLRAFEGGMPSLNNRPNTRSTALKNNFPCQSKVTESKEFERKLEKITDVSQPFVDSSKTNIINKSNDPYKDSSNKSVRHSSSICSKVELSKGIGPESPDVNGLIKSREDHKRIMEQKELQKKQLQGAIHKAANCAPNTLEQTLKSTKESKKSIPDVHSEPENNVNPILLSLSLAERLDWVTEGIFDNITPYDVRCLTHFLDLLERQGDFQCAFPAETAESSVRYLSFFEKPRYSNLLIAAFLHRFPDTKQGIDIISKMCENGVHLKSGYFGDVLDVENIWKPRHSSNNIAVMYRPLPETTNVDRKENNC